MNISHHKLLQQSDHKVRERFANFLSKPFDYRSSFLQSNFELAFDGYSYWGQEDSLNQYSTDMLHSFVLSDLHEIDRFPVEFQDFLRSEWPRLIEQVKNLEIKLIKENNLPFEHLYKEDKITYMMSCNYYPKPTGKVESGKDNTRLSAHTDVSLFTTFPYGISRGLSYLQNGKQLELGEKNETITFSGYLTELLSNGEVKALKHQVELPSNDEAERFSFALFSIPKPSCKIEINGKLVSGKEYYSKYLSLF